MITSLLLIHAAATLIMVGVIWVIQLVHYPLFALVGRENFTAYERSHTLRIGVIVIPTMMVEAITAAGLVIFVGGAAPLSGALLLVIIWGSTWGLQVPCHERLAVQFDEGAWRRLVRTNWIRTVGWTGRGAIALALLLV
ncbi:MAG: hypothetical protein RL417_2261 [Pseudomonadota bacterium]|jgi:hypothetical protein